MRRDMPTLSRSTPKAVAKTIEAVGKELQDMWFDCIGTGMSPNSESLAKILSMSSDCMMAARFIRLWVKADAKCRQLERRAQPDGCSEAGSSEEPSTISYKETP